MTRLAIDPPEIEDARSIGIVLGHEGLAHEAYLVEVEIDAIGPDVDVVREV